MNNLSLISDGFGVNSPELIFCGLNSSSTVAVIVGNMPLITDGFGGNASDVILSGLLKGSVVPQTDITLESISIQLADLQQQIQNIPTPEEVASAVWSKAIENGMTAEEVTRLMAAALAGKVSGADTSTIKFRDLADTKDIITATVDADGNRTAITYGI